MFRQGIVIEFLTFAAFYVVLKGLMHFANIEARRNGYRTVAGVTGLLA